MLVIIYKRGICTTWYSTLHPGLVWNQHFVLSFSISPTCFLSNLSLQTQETREILHFHYTTWPDFGVPESPASFLNFLFKVRESGCLNSDQGPVVVHCSAGIGRSGTFCLVDTCLLLVCTNSVLRKL